MRNVYQHDPEPLDPKGKLRKIAEEQLGIKFDDLPVKVNLGCGPDYLEDWINIDGDRKLSCEIHCELDSEDIKLPLETESVDLIYASHILEHIWYLRQLKQELLRVLKPGGFIIIVVPYYQSYDAWGDDTHCRAFSQASFSKVFWENCVPILCMPLNVGSTKKGQEDRTWILAALRKDGDLVYESKVNRTTQFCRDCGWCCAKSNFPVPTNDYFRLNRMLELYYRQGHPLYWEPTNGKWYILLDQPCQYYDQTTKQCKVFGTKKRPEICGDFICGFPGRIYKRYDVLLAGSQRILKQKFGE